MMINCVSHREHGVIHQLLELSPHCWANPVDQGVLDMLVNLLKANSSLDRRLPHQTANLQGTVAEETNNNQHLPSPKTNMAMEHPYFFWGIYKETPWFSSQLCYFFKPDGNASVRKKNDDACTSLNSPSFTFTSSSWWVASAFSESTLPQLSEINRRPSTVDCSSCYRKTIDIEQKKITWHESSSKLQIESLTFFKPMSPCLIWLCNDAMELLGITNSTGHFKEHATYCSYTVQTLVKYTGCSHVSNTATILPIRVKLCWNEFSRSSLPAAPSTRRNWFSTKKQT